MTYTINIRGRLVDLKEPQVMGILNATPDSFYASSRKQTEEEIALRTREIIAQGGSIIDVGACSTRPGSAPVSQEEEMRRLRHALPIVRREQPEAILSVDTFRPDVARMAVEELGADIINDVGVAADQADMPADQTEMFRTVASLQVPYIYMSVAPDTLSILKDFALRVQRLRDLGQKDIILDPGFGFGKTLEQNYAVLRELERLHALELPLLIGLSRKRMVWQLLGITPDEALGGTTVLHTLALLGGANILRVHDVREAVQAVAIVKKTFVNRGARSDFSRCVVRGTRYEDS